MLSALGNKDLKLLQNLITAEKFAISSAQKLADDWVKAADSLKAWGAGEGDDLSDILDKSRELLVSVSAALAQLCAHENAIRVHMKAVRTREEGLNELKRRRKQVGTKAEAAEKKLNKMSPEHKQLQMQQDLLNQLREEMRLLDSTILEQEAQLGDYKRQTTKDWMTLKFGGLSELAERVMIVGNTGKQLMESIPLDQTQPGVARAPYVAQAQTNKLFTSASQRIGQVTFQSAPSDFTYRNEPDPEAGLEEGQAQDFAEPHTAGSPVEFAQPQGGLSVQPQPTSHSRFASSPAGRDLNRSPPPQTHTRSVTLSNNVGRPTPMDEPPSPTIQPGNLAPPPYQPSRPSSEYGSQSRRRLASGLSEKGSDSGYALEATDPSVLSGALKNQANASAPSWRSNIQPSGPLDFEHGLLTPNAFRLPPSRNASSIFTHQQQPSHEPPSLQQLIPQDSGKGEESKAAEPAAPLENVKEPEIYPSRPLTFLTQSSVRGVSSYAPLGGGSMLGSSPSLPIAQETFSDYGEFGAGPPRETGSPEPNRFQPAPTLSLSFSGEDSKFDFPWMK